MQPKEPPLTFLTMKQVEARTSLTRRSIYRYMNEGRFPKSVHVSESRIAFVESEIVAWLKERMKERDPK